MGNKVTDTECTKIYISPYSLPQIQARIKSSCTYSFQTSREEVQIARISEEQGEKHYSPLKGDNTGPAVYSC